MKAFLTALAQIAAYITKYFSDRQLIRAGEDKESLKQLKRLQDSVDKTNSIRNSGKPNSRFLRPDEK